jgi:hypothetical protein
MKEIEDILVQNLSFFKPPSSTSRDAVKEGATFIVGQRKFPNEESLRKPATHLSDVLVSPGS